MSNELESFGNEKDLEDFYIMKKRMILLTLLLAGGMTAANPLLSEAGQATVHPLLSEAGSKVTDSEEEISGRFSQIEYLTAGAMAIAAGRMAGETAIAAGGEAMSADADVSAHEVPTVASEYADIAIAQVNNYVNVRKEPNTESEILGKLYNNSAATVLETTEDGWYRIKSGTVEGYVKAEYVVVGDEELAKSVSTRYATVTTTTLFVRSEPSTEARIITMLPEGDDLVALDESVEGWIKVSTEEGDGYISGDYVAMSTEYVEAESREEEEARLAREEAERQAAAEAARKAREAEEAARRQSAASKSNSSSGKSSSSNSSSSNGSGSSSNSSGSSSNGSGSSGSSNSSGGSGSSNSSVSNGQAVVNYAMKFLGNPYVYGGTSLTNGADCSGFVQSVYAAFGVSLPRTSAEQRSAGYAVSLSDIQPGDIICYSGHVGIYVGNNTLIHASTEKTGIILTSPITYRKVLSVRRIF